jgi:lipoate-protein ligase A
LQIAHDRDQGLQIGEYRRDLDLLERAALDGAPQVRVLAAERVEVVLGSGSWPDRELQLENCIADRAVLTRRAGGGCSVVLDPGNLVASIVLPEQLVPGIRTAFERISLRLISALARLGIDSVEQRGTSDLAIGDRKIGGACLYKPRGLAYYSTTLLVESDIDLIERYLVHPPREPDYRRGRGHRDFVANLRQLHPRSLPAIGELGRQLEEILSAW